MPEEFLHYIWKYQLLNPVLISTTGEEVRIIKPGIHNSDAGPDFIDARIVIGNTLWAGNIEIHLKSSEWIRHGHHRDEKYKNVILHVVFEDNYSVQRQNGEPIPVLCVKDKFNAMLLERYKDIMKNLNQVPCEKLINTLDTIIIESTLERMVIERFEEKQRYIKALLDLTGNDWEEVFYVLLAKNFGFRLNAIPFEMLAKSTPYKLLLKHRNSLFQIEALLFGQAGLLNNDFKDAYPSRLKLEYLFLQKKYNLVPIETHLWNLLRLRPANFPYIRISQFANLTRYNTNLFSKIISALELIDIRPLFELMASDYWKTHFLFDKSSPRRKKSIGRRSVDLILINTVIPLIFTYGSIRNNPEIVERAIEFLNEVKGEQNKIIRVWKEIGLQTDTAFHTQALLQLKEMYCDQKKCLQCRIGTTLFNQI